jgi:phenylpropionate dioxygenase-like ring-hydroxylating dioxygenase large terminal subunit
MSFLRNTWYVAGWAKELQQGTLLGRTLLKEEVLLFRDAEGTARALVDRCPHRFAPLSMGKLVDGVVQCPYHGLRFDASGHCVLNPHGPVPRAANVGSFPLIERYSALWIWMGDPAQADASLIPDFSFLDPQHWYVGANSMLVNGHYELETDNILDLSHIEFLHPLFSSEAVRRGKIKCEQDGETVWCKRFITEDRLTGFLSQAFNVPDGALADRWLDVRWNAPACMALWTGGVVSGQPRERGVVTPSAHLFTPQDERTTYYFYAMSFPHAMGPAGEQAAQASIGVLDEVFTREDKPMIEAQARNMKDREFWSLKPVFLAGDAAAVHARRILAKRIAAESGQSVSG